MIYLFALLNALDVVLTYLALRHADMVEANPIGRSLFARFGFWPGAIVPKLLLIGLFILLANPLLNILGCVAMAGVVAWNAAQLLRLHTP